MVRYVKRLAVCGLAVSLGILGGCSPQPQPASPTAGLESVPPAPGPTPLAVAQPTAATKPEVSAQVPSPAPEKKVVKVWDFVHLEQTMWDWQFPGGTPQQSPNGAFYVAKKKGPGPVLRGADIDASAVHYIRVYLSVFKRTGEELVPVDLDRLPLWWVTEADTTRDDKWPFRDEQAISLTHVDAGPPTVFIGKLEGNAAWTGRIGSIAIGIPVPDEDLDADEQFKIEVAKIEFLQ